MTETATVRVYPPGRYAPQTFDEHDGSVAHEEIIRWSVKDGILLLDRGGVSAAVMYAPGAWGRVEVSREV